MQKVCAIVLCAGDGKRMKSRSPKVLCEVLFRPMVNWIEDSLKDAGISEICLVCSDSSDAVQQAVPSAAVVIQHERLGTGHAVMQAREFLARHQSEDCIVLNGDAPFMNGQVITSSYRHHKDGQYAMTVITADLQNPFAYGRIVRDPMTGLVRAIVEQADTDSATAALHEVNSGGYWFNIDFLMGALNSFTTNNKQGEYYLTDSVSYASKKLLPIGGYKVTDPDVILGANDRAGLLRLNEIARAKNIAQALECGAELLCTDGIIIANGVEIGAGTRILPNTVLKPGTKIGSDCVIGPNTVIENSTVGNDTVVNASQVFDSELGCGVRVGPYTYIRPNCKVHDNAKIGDFVELKNSEIGEKTSIAHLSYIGDTTLGANVNMGGGVITCNYDGKNKFRTVIEDDCFIGCNTNLVAPVKVERGAYVAAGSTITHDVPQNALSIARAQQVDKQNWKDRRNS